MVDLDATVGFFRANQERWWVDGAVVQFGWEPILAPLIGRRWILLSRQTQRFRQSFAAMILVGE